MKIVLYSHYFTPEIGAPSARLHDMAKQWIALGHQVQVVTCFPNHPTGEIYPGYCGGKYLFETLDGIGVHRHWTYITPNKGFIKKTLGHLTYWFGAKRWSNRRVARPDVVIGSSPTFFAAMAAASKARRCRVPFIMEVRDLWPAIFVELGVLKNPRIIKLLEKWEMALYRRADRIVVVTEAFKTNLIERGVPTEKLRTITNGADADYWQPSADAEELRERLGLKNRFVALYIGAHGISQALSKILDAAQILENQAEIQFVFVGEGAENEMLMEKAREAKLQNVHFLDPVSKDEVRDYYALADVCLVPLRDIPLFDTFVPSKMFEMLAMERPIIASVRGEAAYILCASGGALVVEPEDSAAIAAAIVQLQKNPRQAQEMGRQGREFVQAQYSRRALATTYLNIMEEAISQYSRRSR